MPINVKAPITCLVLGKCRGKFRGKIYSCTFANVALLVNICKCQFTFNLFICKAEFLLLISVLINFFPNIFKYLFNIFSNIFQIFLPPQIPWAMLALRQCLPKAFKQYSVLWQMGQMYPKKNIKKMRLSVCQTSDLIPYMF